MRFHLVDRILDLAEGRRIDAVKIVSPLDPVIENHPAAGPCLPPMLVVEALAQASAWMVMATTDFAQRGVLGGFRRILVSGPAPVGHRLDIVSEVEGWSKEAVMFTSWANEAVTFTVNASRLGKPVVQVEGALCLLVDTEILEDPAHTRHHYQSLCRQEPKESVPLDAEPVQGGSPTLGPVPPPQWFPYDILEQCVPGESAVARKAVVMADPVFETHFPRFPIMPGSLAVQSLIEVARKLLDASTDDPSGFWEPTALQGIRFQRYVRPGDALVLTARLLNLSADEAQVAAVGEIDGQKAFSLRKISFTRAHEQPESPLPPPSPSAEDSPA